MQVRITETRKREGGVSAPAMRQLSDAPTPDCEGG